MALKDSIKLNEINKNSLILLTPVQFLSLPHLILMFECLNAVILLVASMVFKLTYSFL